MGGDVPPREPFCFTAGLAAVTVAVETIFMTKAGSKNGIYFYRRFMAGAGSENSFHHRYRFYYRANGETFSPPVL